MYSYDIPIYIYIYIYKGAEPALLPVEVRCYMSVRRCLARDARYNTMSHLTADAACSYMSRAKRLM